MCQWFNRAPPIADGFNTAYHQQLKIAFLSGMRPEISSTIKKTLVGWGLAELGEVKRYTIHYEQHGKSEETKNKLKGAEYLMATLGEIASKGSDRKGWKANRRGDKDRDRDNDRCFNCNKSGHFARDCEAPCRHCKKVGHNHRDCRSKKDRRDKRSRRPQPESEEEEEV